MAYFLADILDYFLAAADKQILQEWLSQHPGGAFLFAQTIQVERSKTKRVEPTPITRDEAHDHFQRTLAGSKWQVLKG